MKRMLIHDLSTKVREHSDFRMIVLAEEQNVLNVTLTYVRVGEAIGNCQIVCEYWFKSYLRVDHDHAYFIVFQTTDAATATVCGSNFPGC
jgi:hypothetical protein